MSELSGDEYEAHMNRTWRKFGPLLFRPVCTGCTGCRPIRIAVAEFSPGRGQRRTLRRNADLRVVAGPPVLDRARIDLYHRYHLTQQRRKGWPEQRITPQEYEFQFLRNPLPAVEISVWEGERLRAIILNDLTPQVLSAVYHFHDPDAAGRGLGTFAILQAIEQARLLRRTWVYLGYYVAGSASMEYKSAFRPAEVLGEDGVWRPLAAPDAIGA